MNIGGYDDFSFDESEGNRILSGLLEKGRLIKTYFNQGDKFPNFDGYFEICKSTPSKKEASGTFRVQIKTLPRDYTNSNSRGKKSDYKYSCESKIFCAVKNSITLDPVILFLVDTQFRKVFFIHVTLEYVLMNRLDTGENKTIYFNEIDLLAEDTCFSIFNAIITEYKRKLTSEPENTVTVSENLDKKILIELQENIDRFNSAMDNELLFIKQHFYPNVWKFGIAYVAHDEMFATIGIYKVLRGNNGTLIRLLNKENQDDCTTVSYYRISMKSIRDIVDGQMLMILNDYFEKAYIDPVYLPTIVLEELAFHFLDTIARYCERYENQNKPCTYYKDNETLEQIEKFWEALVKYSLELLPNEPCPAHGEKREYRVDPFSSLLSGYNADVNNALFYRICENSSWERRRGVTLVFSGSFEYRLIQRVIGELRTRNQCLIDRVWRPHDYNGSFEELKKLDQSKQMRFETGYLLKDSIDNLKLLIKLLPQCYEEIGRNIFRDRFITIALNNQYLISIEPTNEAGCICVVQPGERFSISTVDSFGVEITEDYFGVIRQKYPASTSIIHTHLYGVFSSSYPLYNNLASLIKKTVFRKFDYKLSYDSKSLPI